MGQTDPLQRLDEYLYTVEATGFCRVPGFLEPTLVERLNSQIDGWHARFLAEHKYTPAKFPFFDLDPIYLDLMAHDLIVKIGCHFCGEWFRFDHSVGLQQPGRIKFPNGKFQDMDDETGDLHGGPFASQGSCLVAYDQGRLWFGQLNVGFVLKEQRPDQGGFCYVPGSHHVQGIPNNGAGVRKGVLKGQFFNETIVIPALQPGDMVVFSEALVHGTTPWKATDRVRRNVYFKYSPGFMAWQSYDKIAKYAALARTDVQRRLLRPPYTASFDDVPTVQVHAYREPTPDPSTTTEKLLETAKDPLEVARAIRRKVIGY